MNHILNLDTTIKVIEHRMFTTWSVCLAFDTFSISIWIKRGYKTKQHFYYYRFMLKRTLMSNQILTLFSTLCLILGIAVSAEIDNQDVYVVESLQKEEIEDVSWFECIFLGNILLSLRNRQNDLNSKTFFPLLQINTTRCFSSSTNRHAAKKSLTISFSSRFDKPYI